MTTGAYLKDRWRPERDVNDRWICVHYRREGSRMHRYADGEWRGGTFVGQWFDLLSQCDARAAELNAG